MSATELALSDMANNCDQQQDCKGPDNFGVLCEVKTKQASENATSAKDEVANKAIIVDMLPAENDDRLDVFERLELELAELNKSASIDENDAVEFNQGITTDNSKVPSEVDGKMELSNLKMQNEVCAIKNNIIQSPANATELCQNGETPKTTATLLEQLNEAAGDVLDHEDLIAVLKGEPKDEPKPTMQKESQTNKPDELPVNRQATSSDYVGVTIEGEGEYQIMEVVDDFEDDLETNVIGTAYPQVTTITQQLQPAPKLTREEERAVAMEQIAGLKRGPRRRKQDIKPLPVETSELVSTIGADWSDDGDDVGQSTLSSRPSTSKSVTTKKEQSGVGGDYGDDKSKKPPTNSSDVGALDSKAITNKGGQRKRRRSAGANITSVIVLPPQQEIGIESSSEEPTGFKRTRTIKRRIIWDPDAPETTISYADLVHSKSKDRQSSASPNIATQKSRSVTPKEKQHTVTDVVVVEKKTNKRAPTPLAKAKDNLESSKTKSAPTKPLYRSQTVSPISNGGNGGVSGGTSTTIAATVGHSEPRKKKISEIDRLMRDEGAASMLSSLESGRNILTDEIDDDKPHKPLMRSRVGHTEKANKREGTPVATTTTPPGKKTRTPKAKHSASWDYVYQKNQQISDDSMIIRRRSNSSYSSNASLHRLSIEGPVAAQVTSASKVKSKGNKATKLDVDKTESNTNPASSAKSTPKQKIQKQNASKDNSQALPNIIKSGNGSNKNVASLPINENSKSFEFLKPKESKQKNSNKTATNRRSSTVNNEQVESTLKTDMKKAPPKRGRQTMSNKQKDLLPSSPMSSTLSVNTSINSAIVNATDFTNGTNVVVRKTGKIAQIYFSAHASKMNGAFNTELMNQIVDALDTLAHDASCNVVVLLTNGAEFCRGLDLSSLINGANENRRSAAIILATAAKNLLRTLATFPKPLVTGINGAVVGLGVIILPLFDVVISSDKTTLETPYLKIGQIPEGFCIWQQLWSVRNTAKTKLFWLAEKMISTDATSAGIVTKLTTSDKVNDDAIAAAKKMANMSSDTFRYMKKITMQTRLDVFMSAIDDEFEEIIKQWTTPECCTKIKKFIENGGNLSMI